MLRNITEKTLTNTFQTTISDIIDDDLYPEYLPAQNIEEFHRAEEKLKMNNDYKKNVVSIFCIVLESIITRKKIYFINICCCNIYHVTLTGRILCKM